MRVGIKWRLQPDLRGPSWQATIKIQRLELADLFESNPSLRALAPGDAWLARRWEKARVRAMAETGLADLLPAVCPWSAEEALEMEFWRQG